MGRMYQVFAVLAKFRNVAESNKNRNFPEASLSPINPNPFYFSLITSEKILDTANICRSAERAESGLDIAGMQVGSKG